MLRYRLRLGERGGDELRRLLDAENVQQEFAFELAGPVPPGFGQGLVLAQPTAFVALEGLAHAAVQSAVVLVLQLAFANPPPGLLIAEHPVAATLDLYLGDPGSAAERMIGEPLA